MTEFLKIFITAAVTIIGGLVIFSGERLLEMLFIKPLLEFKKLIGEIEYSLIYYADAYTTSRNVNDKKCLEASDIFRQQASKLNAIPRILHFYNFWKGIFRIPERSDVIQVFPELIRLSNSVISSDPSSARDNRKSARNIAKFLNINIDGKHESKEKDSKKWFKRFKKG